MERKEVEVIGEQAGKTPCVFVSEKETWKNGRHLERCWQLATPCCLGPMYDDIQTKFCHRLKPSLVVFLSFSVSSFQKIGYLRDLSGT